MATDWAVQIDWDKNNNFDDVGDNIWADVMTLTWKLGMGRAYQLVADETTCKIAVRNTDGKYNPENTTSPLYGKLLPQRPIQIKAGSQVLWRGWVKSIVPDWTPAGSHTGQTYAVIQGVGAKQFLQETEIALPLQQNKRGDQIISEVLRRVVLPPAIQGGWILGKVGFSELGVTTRLARESDYAELETGLLTFAYYGDTKTTNGYTIIKDITEAERGRFFFNRLGKAVWWNRDHLQDDAIDDGVVDSSGVAGCRPSAVDYQHGASVANRVQVTAYPRKVGSTIPLWTLDKPVTIPVGGSVSFEAPFTDDTNQPAGALNAVATGVTFSAGSGSVSVSTQAERATLTITNTDTVEAVLSALTLEGQVLTSHNRVVARLEDAESVRAYGRRGEIKLNLKALEDYQTALEIAASELLRRKTPRGEVKSLTLLNEADDTANADQLAWSIGTRLQVNLSELGHHLPYFIVGEEHTVSQGGKIHETQLILEPAIPTRLAAYPKEYADVGVNMKGSDDKTRLAQSFEVSAGGEVGSVGLWLRKIGNPTGDLTLSIFSNHLQGGGWRLGVVGSSELGVTTRLAADSDYPDVALTNGVSQSIPVSSLSTAYGWVEFTFSTPPNVDMGTRYWAVLSSTASSSVDCVQWGADGTDPTYSLGWMLSERGGSWKLEAKDAAFEVFLAL